MEAFDGHGAKVVGTTPCFSGIARVTGIAVVIGGAGDDTLAGGSGADSLMGSVGDDRLSGGGGNDTMAGGPRLDCFVFGQDRSTDLDANLAAGQDLPVPQGFGPSPTVGIAVEGTDTRVTIGADSVLLVGVTGLGARVIAEADFLIL